VRYRSNVAAIVENDRGEILICERRDVAGAWQFPQGGVDAGETNYQAIARELFEEIGLHPESYEVQEVRGPYQYEFPGGTQKRGYDGQRQHYYRVLLTGSDDSIIVDTPHPEFRSLRWIRPATFDLTWVPQFKRDVYRQVFADFYGL